MSEGKHLAEAVEQLFTSSTPGWFTPFTAVLDGMTAAQAAAVPADRFNSVWGVVNHVRFWQEAALRQLKGEPVDYAALGSADGSGWPPAGGASDEKAWAAAKAAVVAANKALAVYVAGLSDSALDEAVSDNAAWNTRRHLVQSMIAHNSYHTCELISIRHMQGQFFGAM